FDKAFGQRQAQAGAFVFAAEAAVDLAEALERLGNVLGRNADAAIGDGDGDSLCRLCGRHTDFAAARRELDRVGEQVEQDLAQPSSIGAEQGNVGAGGLGDAYARGVRLSARHLQRAAYDLVDIERLLIELEPAGVDLREIENVVDEREQMR